MKQFESFMAGELDKFVAFREQSGRCGNQSRKGLLTFDRYLSLQKATWEQLAPKFFLHFRMRIGKNPNTANHTLSAVRIFFQFLMRRGIVDENPLQDIPPLGKRYFVPFIFEPGQIERLLKAACDGIDKSQKRFLPDTAIYLAIMLLARCGMRINEPLRLKIRHYRIDDGTLYIEKTKFRKDRLIAIP